MDKSGNVYITDWSDGNVRKVASDGTITRIAGWLESLDGAHWTCAH